MKYYPVCLDIDHKECLVVGGGSVGTRKVKTLLECGARVTLVSLEVTKQIQDLSETGRIVLKRRAYQSSDMEGMFLVIGATDVKDLNQRIHADATRLNTLCNIADKPDICNFILPSILRQGDLLLSISTSGKSPAMAKHIRKELEKEFGPEYSVFLQLMGAIRKKLLSQAHEPEAHKSLFEDLIGRGLLDMIRNNDKDRINALLENVLGAGYDFDRLLEAISK